ncbi:histone-lysine N-methyltransferase SETMAR-like [Eupeodes corollae]|uniref:histone-lysine N-methyltransferase SETMAR-like n=1 Tax=Eupeodes corollae TaxID=290404 RepID=UPI0024922DFA|nr:histone-lysine N-methyltransferase SETMAR-like [Eupeodes corollae]
MERIEVRAVTKYLCLKKMSPKDIHSDLVDTLGNYAPPYAIIERWIKEFQPGKVSKENEHREGRQLNSNSLSEDIVKKVEDFVLADRRVTIRHVAEITGISYGSVQRILANELHLKKVTARWVPRMLNDEQKKKRIEISRANLEMFQKDQEKFLFRFVTMDEIWIHHFHVETNQQTMAWKRDSSPTAKKCKVSSSEGKVMASVFWDAEGVIMIEYLEKGDTITSSYYADQIRRLEEAIDEKRGGKLKAGVLFHQDNASPHKAAADAIEAIQEMEFELLEHPPHSPDLSPSDYYLFRRVKEHLRGKRFDDDSEVMTTIEAFLEGQSKDFFSKGIMGLEKRWDKCIEVLGDYVE